MRGRETLFGGILSGRIGRILTFQIGYALGTILGGASAPTVAQLLLNRTGWSPSAGIYIMVLCVIFFHRREHR